MGPGLSGQDDGPQHHQAAVEKGGADIRDFHVVRQQDARRGQDHAHALQYFEGVVEKESREQNDYGVHGYDFVFGVFTDNFMVDRPPLLYVFNHSTDHSS